MHNSAFWCSQADSKTWELAENGIGESLPESICVAVAIDPETIRLENSESRAGGR